MWKNSNYFHRRYCSTMSSILHSCVLIILIVSVNGNWEKIGERILNKISKLSRASNKDSRRLRNHRAEKGPSKAFFWLNAPTTSNKRFHI